MPRILLTDEEAKLILRQREVEDAHRKGWNKALDYVTEVITNTDPTMHELYKLIQELKK